MSTHGSTGLQEPAHKGARGRRPSGVRARLASFRFAGRGVAELLAREPNARLHAVASVGVVIIAAWLRVAAVEWALLILAMALVWAAEAFNSAVERLADVVSPGEDARIGRAKDLAAAGVLASAIGALIIGLLVFGPRVATFLR